MEKEQDKELPAGWAECLLIDFCCLNMGQSPDSTTYNKIGDGLPFYQGKTDFGDLYPTPTQYCNKPNKIGEPGDVILSVRAPVGPTNMLNHSACIGRGLAAITPSGNISSKFVLFLFRSVQHDMSNAGTGTTFKAVTKDFLNRLKFNIPPLPEQHRIVAKIEELFSELDKGVESLKAAQEQLKIYRQAVLQRAFEGKLTEEWRRAKKDLPTRDALWKQIQEALSFKLKEREIRPKKIESLSEEELGELSELPSEWVWVKLGNVAWSLKDGPHYSPHYVESGIPFISGGNVRPEGVDFLNAKFISPELHKELSKRCLPEAGDILYTKGGTTGIARVNTYGSNFNVWVHVAVIKLIDGLLPFYVQHCLNSPHCYKQSQKFTHGVGNQDLGLTRMIKITLPICSQSEQHQVVAEIESRLSVCDKLEESIAQSLLQAEALRQSILKKAFEGKLVPQDPQDEPAEKLLARIRAERAQTQPTRKIAKGRKKQ